MKKTIVAVLAATASAAMAESFHVGNAEDAVMNIEGDVEQQVDASFIAPGGTVHKTGAGTWDVRSSVLHQSDGAIAVREGKLKLTLDNAVGSPVAAPAALAGAAIWLDASLSATRTDLFAGSATGVTAWYDAREAAERSAPAYPYASAVGFGSLEASAPEQKAFSGKSALYFGGVGNGHFMHLMTSGGAFLHDSMGKFANRFKHVFVVHSVESSYGELLGSDGVATSGDQNWLSDQWLIFGGARGGDVLSSTILLNDSYKYPNAVQVAAAKAYVDGARVDAFSTVVTHGRPTLLSFDASLVPLRFDTLFTLGQDASLTGGDYLHEVIAFTSPLLESERVQIADYLMRKWGIRNAGANMVELADGTMLDVVAEDSGTVALAGSGEVSKSGTGTVRFTVPDRPFTGTLTMDSGTAVLGGNIAMKVPATASVTAADGAGGTEVTVAAGATAGEIVKDGNATLRLAEVPAGTTRIRVNAGTLSLGKPTPVTTLAGGADVSVALANPGFEDYFTGEHEGDLTPWFDVGLPVAGWAGKFYYANLRNWTFDMPKSGSGLAAEATRNAFQFMWDAPEGDSVIVLRGGTSAWASQSVALPKAGVYRVTGRISGRRGSAGNATEILLVDSNRQELSLGTVVYRDESCYAPFMVFGEVPAAGQYTLKLRNRGSNGDCGQAIDDLKMTWIARTARTGAFKIPHGDFEQVDWLANATDRGDAALMRRYSGYNRPEGWTLTQPEPRGASDTNPGVAPGLLVLSDDYVSDISAKFLNVCEFPYGGNNGLFFRAYRCDGARAETTFVAPASGRYFLRARLAGRGDVTLVSVGAEVSVAGGTAVSLGSVQPWRKDVMDYGNWPVSFVVAEGDSVTLALTGTNPRNGGEQFADGGVDVDDLELVPADDPSVELVSNGSFELGSDGWTQDVRVPGWEFGGIEKVSAIGWHRLTGGYSVAENYGRSAPDGQHLAYFANRMYLRQQAVVVPADGFYRGSFLAHRGACAVEGHKDAFTYANPVVRGWLEAADGSTNVFVEATIADTSFAEYGGDVYLKAGTYALFVEGLTNYGWADGMQALAVVDRVSLRPSSQQATDVAADVLPEHLKVDVAEGAKLNLPFAGKVTLGSVRYAGQYVHGVISAETHPEFVTGSGEVELNPNGSVIIFR